jgi:hypothetical protein
MRSLVEGAGCGTAGCPLRRAARATSPASQGRIPYRYGRTSDDRGANRYGAG